MAAPFGSAARAIVHFHLSLAAAPTPYNPSSGSTTSPIRLKPHLSTTRVEALFAGHVCARTKRTHPLSMRTQLARGGLRGKSATLETGATPYPISTVPASSGGPLKPAVPTTVWLSRSMTRNHAARTSAVVATRNPAIHVSDTSPTRKDHATLGDRSPNRSSNCFTPSISARISAGASGSNSNRGVIIAIRV